jgi:hypothetical protein
MMHDQQSIKFNKCLSEGKKANFSSAVHEQIQGGGGGGSSIIPRILILDTEGRRTVIFTPSRFAEDNKNLGGSQNQ